MGKVLRKFTKDNVSVKMQRQRSSYGKGWEFPVWVEIEDKEDKGSGWQQDPRIFQEKNEADAYFNEIESEMKRDLKWSVHIYAPQIQGHL